jgi:hypothetical protein
VAAAVAKADQNPKGHVNNSGARPINPYLVLLAAILLPGFGQVLCGETRRGFTMQMFMVALAIVTWHLAPLGTSLVGKLAGGVFIYAISVVDAYAIARRRWVAFRKDQK